MSSTITPHFPFFYLTCIYSTDQYILLCSSQWIAAALSASLWEIVRPVNIHLIDENVFCHGVMNEVKWRMMSGSLQHLGDVVQVVTKLWRPQHFIKWHTASYTTPWKYCSTLFFFLSSLVFAPFITDCTIQIPRETKIHPACLEVNNFTDVIKICIDVFSLHQRLIWLQELFDYLKQLKYIYITVYIAVHKSFWITVVSFSSMKYNVLTAIFELFLWDGSIRYSV